MRPGPRVQVLLLVVVTCALAGCRGGGGDLPPPAAEESSYIVGVVVEGSSTNGGKGPPVAGATVEIRKNGKVIARGTTDQRGRYRLASLSGDVVVYARRTESAPAEDAQPVTVGPDVSGPGEDITVDLTLALRDREPPIRGRARR